MRNFKHVVFWVLFLALVTALLWRQPVRYVALSSLFVLPVGFVLWLFVCGRSKPSALKLPSDLRTRFDRSNIKSSNDLQAHSDLLSMCMGNVATVDRLIQYELSKQPRLSRAQATRAARDRLRYERGR